ncbi:hypothetical protein B296_00039830, partial [Ensete ventricosum]
EIEKYKLGNPQSFHYLNQSKCFKLDGVDDAQEYLATRRAMDIKPGGIIALLDEACYDDKAACQKILDKIGLKGYQVEEAKSTVIKEREAARKAIEAALPIIKENPVLVQDTEKIDLLNAEIENLKDLSPGAPNSRELQNDDKPQKSLNEKQQGIRASPQSAGLFSFSGRMMGTKTFQIVLLEILLILLTVQAPRTSRASLIRGSRSQANAMAQQALIAPWQSIVKSLTNYLKILRANHVSSE